MTYAERLDNIINRDISKARTEEQKQLDNLLLYAYYAGKEKGVKEVSDMATERFEAQRRRARKCRYYKMAGRVVGDYDPWTRGQGFVYHPDYSQSYSEDMGGEIWEGN